MTEVEASVVSADVVYEAVAAGRWELVGNAERFAQFPRLGAACKKGGHRSILGLHRKTF